MLVSRNWLQRYFDTELPGADAIADALTFHAFEIESIEEKGDDAVIDVKVLPNRAADALSHRGIAREIGAILDLPLKPDALRAPVPVFPPTNALRVDVEDARACARYAGAVVRGVNIGPSPAWLREALESVGQRSINNVVDATNFVMLDLGQPLHAFDAAKLEIKDGAYTIAVRGSQEGESITTLSGEAVALPEDTLLITDGNSGAPLGIAGVKGGTAAGITEATTDIVVESANFDGPLVRRAMQATKLYTDAGKRFQNSLSPELVPYALSAVLALIQETAGGTLEGVTDRYLIPVEPVQVPVSVGQVNGLLGTAYSAEDVAGVFARLGFAYARTGDDFTVDPPFERRDITLAADLVEEVGRILGFEKVSSVELPQDAAADQAAYRGVERVKDFLVARGFTEISTQAFAAEGARYLANPLQSEKPALRSSLAENMRAALARGVYEAPRFLGPADAVRLFEIGTVFSADAEALNLCVGLQPLAKIKGDPLAEITEALAAAFPGIKELRRANGLAEWDLSETDLAAVGADAPLAVPALGRFKAYSAYPFVTRDIALWAPAGTEGAAVADLIRAHAGALLARLDQFDRFEKDGRVSYAFRLVFESPERTLTDEDANAAMEAVAAAVAAAGYEVR